MDQVNVQFMETEQKKTKKWAWIATTGYSMAFLFMLPAMLMVVLTAFGACCDSLTSGLFPFIINLMIFLVIPVGIYRIWSRYRKGNYKKSRSSCWMPLYVMGTMWVVSGIIFVIAGGV